MKTQNVRLFLLGVLFACGVTLFNLWEYEHEGAVKNEPMLQEVKKELQPVTEIPIAPITDTGLISNNSKSLDKSKSDYVKQVIFVETDLFSIEIDPVGGDIVLLNLKKYLKSSKENDQHFTLLDTGAERYYVAQSGLLNDIGPDSRSSGRGTYSFKNNKNILQENESSLVVPLNYYTKSGVNITKKYHFKRDSYVISVEYIINNQSDELYSASIYGRLKQRGPLDKGGQFFGVARSYVGAAVNTPEKPYKKLPFEDMGSNPFKQTHDGGWIAMVEHYFTSAWIPRSNVKHQYVSEDLSDNVYGIRFIDAEPLTVYPGEVKSIKADLFAGPEVTEWLKNASPGLELTVDYGVLWFIAQPIFWLLKNVYNLFGNWGWAIIFTTLIIKLLFYHLSASGYRSMGNIRKLQPRIDSLKEQYGEDKQKFGRAVMDLYKREGVNPLGGCFPIVIQIPVFISLYYVLLESVELRQAHFALWITDLSVKDPFYVLPLMMGGSMFLQQKLSPTPPDPMQAKMMMAMPIVFTFLFLQFPSGLVLYWVVQNCLSILQQWYIMRSVDKPTKVKSR